MEFDVCVAVTFDVRLHRFKKKLKWRKGGAKRSYGRYGEEENPNLELVQG